MSKRTDVIFIQNYYWMNLGIMSISAVLKQHGYKTDIAIGSTETILKKIGTDNPRLVGFYSTTGFHHIQLRIAKELKLRFGDSVMTVFGGPHPTFVKSMIENQSVDVICRGEGEHALLELLQALERNDDYTKILNLNVKKDGKVYENPLRPLCDLDQLPFFDREIYRSVPFIYSNKQHVVMFSRGCPYNCAFCTAPALRELYRDHGNYLRLRSIDKVIEELEQLKMRYRPNSLYFYDEIFFRDNKYSSEFLEIYKRKINIPYLCMMRADLINEEVARALKDTGCYFLLFGIENGNESVRNNLLQKNISDRDICSCSSILRKYKIPFATLNIVGFPGEDISHVWDAIRINTLAKPSWSKFFVYQALPATRLADYSLRNGFIKDIDVTPSDASMLNSGIIVRENKDYKKIIRLKYIANIIIKFPGMQKAVKKILLNIPADPIFRLLEKILEFFFYYSPQMYKLGLRRKLAIAFFYIRHRKEFGG